MAYEKSVDFFDIARSMFKYPWLEYPDRTKGEAGIEKNRNRAKGLKRKAPWFPSQAGVWVSSANPWDGSGKAHKHLDGSPQPAR